MGLRLVGAGDDFQLRGRADLLLVAPAACDGQLKGAEREENGATPGEGHDAETAAEVRNLVSAHLGDRERSLIGQRFGRDGAPPQTYAELAVVTGTSRQNVQQLVERALRRLRTVASDVTTA